MLNQTNVTTRDKITKSQNEPQSFLNNEKRQIFRADFVHKNQNALLNTCDAK